MTKKPFTERTGPKYGAMNYLRVSNDHREAEGQLAKPDPSPMQPYERAIRDHICKEAGIALNHYDRVSVYYEVNLGARMSYKLTINEELPQTEKGQFYDMMNELAVLNPNVKSWHNAKKGRTIVESDSRATLAGHLNDICHSTDITESDFPERTRPQGKFEGRS